MDIVADKSLRFLGLILSYLLAAALAVWAYKNAPFILAVLTLLFVASLVMRTYERRSWLIWFVVLGTFTVSVVTIQAAAVR